VWEEDLFGNLLLELDGFDVWKWRLEESGNFTVKSSYDKLESSILLEDKWREEERKVFSCLWKSPAPSKVVAFSWKAILNRIPSRLNLALRNVLPEEVETRCVLCGEGEESTLHLMLHCEVASKVWSKLMTWMEVWFINPPNIFIHWECWSRWEHKKRIRKGLWLIWTTTVWAIWRARNNIIFNEGIVEVDRIVEEVKVLS